MQQTPHVCPPNTAYICVLLWQVDAFARDAPHLHVEAYNSLVAWIDNGLDVHTVGLAGRLCRDFRLLCLCLSFLLNSSTTIGGTRASRFALITSHLGKWGTSPCLCLGFSFLVGYTMIGAAGPGPPKQFTPDQLLKVQAVYAQVKAQGLAQKPLVRAPRARKGEDLISKPVGPFDAPHEPQQLPMSTVWSWWAKNRYRVGTTLEPESQQAFERRKQEVTVRTAADYKEWSADNGRTAGGRRKKAK